MPEPKWVVITLVLAVATVLGFTINYWTLYSYEEGNRIADEQSYAIMRRYAEVIHPGYQGQCYAKPISDRGRRVICILYRDTETPALVEKKVVCETRECDENGCSDVDCYELDKELMK